LKLATIGKLIAEFAMTHLHM